eukprot:827_1
MWGASIIVVVGVAICSAIMYIDIANNTIQNVSNSAPNGIKYLTRWSLFTMGTAILHLFASFLQTIPTLCTYINPKIFGPQPFHQAFFTIYQIGRLHYCFQSHFSKHTFILLYLNG